MFRKYIQIAFYGHSPERFLNLCRQKGIQIWKLEVQEHTYTCYMYAKDFSKLKNLARKASVQIKILEKHGLAFYFFRYRKRRWFQIGIMLAFSLLLLLSRFIWSIKIEGNYSISDDVIFDYLKEQNVEEGMRIRKLDCEQLCKDLRLDFQEIIWVSAALNGTSLTLNVREGRNVSASTQEEEEKYDILAPVDGTITDIITRKGVPKVQKGDYVKAGDVLVSGVLEIKNDAGELVREEETRADADIWIKRELSYQDSCENRYLRKNYKITEKYRLLIHIKQFCVEFGLRKMQGEQERIGKYVSLKLGENFLLPIQIAVEQSREYEFEPAVYSEEEQRKILEERYQRYLSELQENEIELVQEELHFYELKEELQLLGRLQVIQQIVDFY